MFLGIDAGGTQTRAVVGDRERRVGTGQAGPANWTTIGPVPCAQAMAKAAQMALRSAGMSVCALGGTCVALAGYYPPWHEAEARAAMGAALPGVPLRLVPDLVAAWAGATGGRAGIVLVAGTGAVAYGRNAAGRDARAGGWGPLFGDEGGGYWIGGEALRAAARALDGLGPATSLALTEEALRAVYRDHWSRDRVAALCVTVAGHAATGDVVAAGILERAAAELASLIAAVARQLDWGSEPLCVSAVGGVMNAGPPLRQPLERWLAAVIPHARWTAPLGSPLDGALLLAQEGERLCPAF